MVNNPALNFVNPSAGYGIRPYAIQDIPELYQAARESIAEIYPWLPWCHPGYSIEESRSWVHYTLDRWKSGLEYNFCIYDLQDGHFVGGVGINEINTIHRFANLGYWVRSSSTSRDAASTAARLCAEFGLRQLGLLRIEIIAAVENIASQRAALKAGASREGILRNRLVVHGQPHDVVVFSFTPGDFDLS